MSPSASFARRRRNAVHDLLVHRRAQRRRIPAISLERRLRAAVAHQPLGQPIEIGRRHARRHRGFELGQHVRHQLVRRAHPRDLGRRPANDHAGTLPPPTPPPPRYPPPRHPASGRRPPTGTSAALVELDERLRVARVHPQPLPHHLDVVVPALRPAGRRTCAHAVMPGDRVPAAVRANPARRQPLDQRLLRHLDVDDDERRPALRAARRALGLRDRARKPVEHEPVRRVRPAPAAR